LDKETFTTQGKISLLNYNTQLMYQKYKNTEAKVRMRLQIGCSTPLDYSQFLFSLHSFSPEQRVGEKEFNTASSLFVLLFSKNEGII
jgi:hypothetical protein